MFVRSANDRSGAWFRAAIATGRLIRPGPRQRHEAVMFGRLASRIADSGAHTEQRRNKSTHGGGHGNAEEGLTAHHRRRHHLPLASRAQADLQAGRQPGPAHLRR
ncbi:hypothetical protein [Actinoallomurus soli]|uniref:hypothetical protein n=1 Tax=Actinoallomurus soli TaxID=2952535 RepID=UPI003872B010